MAIAGVLRASIRTTPLGRIRSRRALSGAMPWSGAIAGLPVGGKSKRSRQDKRVPSERGDQRERRRSCCCRSRSAPSDGAARSIKAAANAQFDSPPDVFPRPSHLSEATTADGEPVVGRDTPLEWLRSGVPAHLAAEFGDLFSPAPPVSCSLFRSGAPGAGSGPSPDLWAVVCVCGRWLVACRVPYDSSIVVASSSRRRARSRRA